MQSLCNQLTIMFCRATMTQGRKGIEGGARIPRRDGSSRPSGTDGRDGDEGQAGTKVSRSSVIHVKCERNTLCKITKISDVCKDDMTSCM